MTDGLKIFYDGANNTGAGQDKNSTVWRDVSGNGYDFEVSLDGNNHWTDKSYYIDSTANYFPDKVKDIANGDQYTIELALGGALSAHHAELLLLDNVAHMAFLEEREYVKPRISNFVDTCYY